MKPRKGRLGSSHMQMQRSRLRPSLGQLRKCRAKVLDFLLAHFITFLEEAVTGASGALLVSSEKWHLVRGDLSHFDQLSPVSRAIWCFTLSHFFNTDRFLPSKLFYQRCGQHAGFLEWDGNVDHWSRS
jgi:hypothetical protein